MGLDTIHIHAKCITHFYDGHLSDGHSDVPSQFPYCKLMRVRSNDQDDDDDDYIIGSLPG